VKLNSKLREQLKTPLGILIQEKDTTEQNILKHIPENSYIVTVGDATTEKMLNFGIVPSLQIVDGLEKRSKREPPKSGATKMHCQNPPSQITDESIDVIKRAYASKPPTQILVSGEEDLLVIPACIYAPNNSVVLYGQPNEGLVIVPVTDEIRNKTKTLLESME
jgi:uncharacterized protein (UPF0218 family)